ncbi:ribbon-helix-helix domain-containing protein [Patescibacteria group bacterium]|nr:ribbon-helix-helix domain-containing protein [Actinomycetota bacterium]MBU4480545.1 ribbon-helix-helix domain-containing protein [Patescibacteria group bacterium]MCG2791401.1 ribbon-helix-helix domain-containing protein [Actinomycetes bacterium]
MRKNISFSLDEELIKKINEISRVSERTKSWLVKNAIENYLEEIKDVEIAHQRSLDSEDSFISERELKNYLKEKS